MKTLSRLISKIKNGCLRKAKIIAVRYKKEWIRPLSILYREGYIQNFTVQDGKIHIYLRFYNGKNCIRVIKNLIKPSFVIYLKKKHLWLFNRYGGILILSTIKGLKTHEECLREQLGGQALLFLA